jgi:hypothetical protein
VSMVDPPVSSTPFMRFMRARVREQHGAFLAGDDPEVEMHDGTVRIFDQRGESCSLRSPPVRYLRQLATMLHLCADEIERRGHDV